MTSFETHIGYLTSLKLHYIFIPSVVLTELNGGNEKGKFNQRVLVTLNEAETWQGGIVALGDGNGYITISAARMKKLGLDRNDEVLVLLKPDDSKYGHDLCPELTEIFKQEPSVELRFKKLTPGKQRTILYYINQVKTSEKRAERCWLFMQNLSLIPEGKETMKEIMKKQ